MSWNNPGDRQVMTGIIDAVRMYVGDELTRRRIYHVLICDFENRGADALHECLGSDPAFDGAWDELHEWGEPIP